MRRKKAIVLGAGMVGTTMARDLASDPGFDVTVADIRPEALARAAEPHPQSPKARLGTVEIDLTDPQAIRQAVAGYDLVLGALASHLGFEALRAVLEAGKPYCDISFMPEDALELDALAKERGVTAVVDCGVAPGISNLLAGHAVSHLDLALRVDICVGGLPLERRLPFEYKASFAPADVIEEYTRPARFRVGGALVVREALSEPELLDFPGIGTLEAFNTDGCRSLLRTLDAPDLRERTLRYPGHAALMAAFRQAGLFSKDAIMVNGLAVRPLDVTSQLLFPKWQYLDGEADLTVMRVVVEGIREGRRLRHTWNLLDRYDVVTGIRSMSRATAFPAAIMARIIAGGRFSRPGVHPPETPGRDPALAAFMLSELENRGVRYTYRLESF